MNWVQQKIKSESRNTTFNSPYFDSSSNRPVWIRPACVIHKKEPKRPLVWIHDQKLKMYENLSIRMLTEKLAEIYGSKWIKAKPHKKVTDEQSFVWHLRMGYIPKKEITWIK